MSKIDTLIRELQLKKKKIDYISYIVDLLENDKHCIDYSDVKVEVLKKIIPILKEVASSIENDITAPLVQSAKQENSSFKTTESQKQNINTPNNVMSNSDKMNFAMDNRHLASKKVEVLSKNGSNQIIKGVVVGLDAPFVIVKTETGPTINVLLNEIITT